MDEILFQDVPALVTQDVPALVNRPERIMTPEIIAAACITNGMSVEQILEKLDAVYVSMGM